jgi:CHAT domain-containing protein
MARDHAGLVAAAFRLPWPGRPAPAGRRAPAARLASGLAARELLAVSRVATLPIDTVVLAACTTNLGGADDEALSLATAFLAAGARTAFATLWRVPDASTRC